jgi:dienelactone hydrolase
MTDALDLPSFQTYFQPPMVYDAAAPGYDGLRSLFFEGPAWRGKPTRVFAILGLPAGEHADRSLPGIVLVHGGGGSAFADWVRLWTSRGYAAIAMDHCGHVPIGTYNQWQRHDWAGPSGVADLNLDNTPHDPFLAGPPPEQWPYHAAAAVIRAHSLLRAQPQVDPARIGITGISWGGWLTSLVLGLDQRWAAAAPVYGCGLIDTGSAWSQTGQLDPAQHPHITAWLARWEPARHLTHATCPLLWVNGTNDFAYWPPAWFDSGDLPAHPRAAAARCMTLRMEHGHLGPGENPPEIHAFMDHHLRLGPPLPRLTHAHRSPRTLTLQYQAPDAQPVVRAQLLFTCDANPIWPDRVWEAQPAQLDPHQHHAAAQLPMAATAGFINLIDARGLCVTGPLYRADP